MKLGLVSIIHQVGCSGCSVLALNHIVHRHHSFRLFLVPEQQPCHPQLHPCSWASTFEHMFNSRLAFIIATGGYGYDRFASQVPRPLRGLCEGQHKTKDSSVFTLQLVIPPFDVSHHITSHPTSLQRED